jgi:hypothetical protein
MTFSFPHPLRAVCACIALAWIPATSFSQSTPVAAVSAPTPAQQDAANAKKWSVYWGWNRSNYSNSDIHFSGSDHDFTLRGVEAIDIQTDVSQHLFDTYLNPSEITIPQTNLRIAYQYNSDTAIAFNLDHMKYVVVQDQSVPISGQILGVTQSGQQIIGDKWLNYEHTDGLNIVSLELEKQRAVDWFGANHNAKLFGLVGLGVVIPKSNVTMHMINQVRNDEFHFAGYSVSAGAGLEVDVYKDVFFRTAYKMGYVDLPDVLTSSRGDKASQHFTYNELLIALGIRF